MAAANHHAEGALAFAKNEVVGAPRKRQRDRGHALAGKRTLNRLELAASSVDTTERHKEISYDDHGIERLFIQRFVEPTGRRRQSRCTASRRAASSAGSTAMTAICRSTFSAVKSCSAPPFTPPGRELARILSQVQARAGATCGGSCAATPEHERTGEEAHDGDLV